MTYPYESKTAKALREAQQAFVWDQNRESRLILSLNALEAIFNEYKDKCRSTMLCWRKREYAEKAMLTYKEWQNNRCELLEIRSRMEELTQKMRRYEVKIAKTKEYNERRRKRRTEAKQVREQKS